MENMDAQLQRDGAEVSRLCKEMNLTLTPFEQDMVFAAQQWRKDPKSQFWRRTVIRCFFSTTEALLWHMKHAAPKIALISAATLTEDDLLKAKGMKLVMTTGGAKIQRRLQFRENVEASFVLFGKACRVKVTIKDDADFDAFCVTYRLRNRLMHPKRPSDPDVTDLETATSQRGVAWLVNSYVRLLQECADSVQRF
jgi:hypothetical protein